MAHNLHRRSLTIPIASTKLFRVIRVKNKY